MTSLPIEAVLPELAAALRAQPSAVLHAPTGAGKTTRVPLALLEAPWLEGQKIVMLEPRRLAARAAARRMAHLLGERVGQTVGYRVRMDTQVGAETRIEVVTEGVLTRMLQSDPALPGVGAAIFDEFHERNMQADLGLALALEARAVLRPALRLLVMSATLDAAPVADLLGEAPPERAPLVTSEGRSFPVETQYLERRPTGRVEDFTAAAVRAALEEETGDVLVFLPGAGEIRRTQRRLAEGGLPQDVDVRPLFGNLSHREQDRAIAPSPEGRRKVVLSTDIAETSLTIEGIRVVVDAGLQRTPRFDPRSGMTRLETVHVSKASADQRKGRAGRLAPGVCRRLWTHHTQQHLAEHTAPEIQQADLAPLALDLAQWGAPDPAALRWLDPPPEAAFAQARALLGRLGALDADGLITDHGRDMASLGLHPRLAHLVLSAQTLGLGAVACDLAALLGERDLLKGQSGPPSADLRLRLEVLQTLRRGDRSGLTYVKHSRVDRGAARRVRRVARHWRRRLGISKNARSAIEASGLLLAFAYPDRIAQQVGQTGRFRLQNGRAATFSRPQLLSDADYLVAAHLGGRGPEPRILLAAPVALDDLEAHFGRQIEEKKVVAWNAEARLVRARQQQQLGALVLKDGPLSDPDPQALAAALASGIRSEGLLLLPWTKNARQLQERLVFLHRHAPEDWPDFSDEALLDTLGDWLGPHLYGLKRADDLQRLNLTEILKENLSWEQRRALDDLAPTHLAVPSGSRRRLDYSDPEAPVLAVRLQEMFGQTKTPRIAGGRVPLTVHLLSPAQRPVQITQDLESFWKRTYFEVKKDMQGRYPKHYWPEDPFAATPTRHVRPRS